MILTLQIISAFLTLAFVLFTLHTFNEHERSEREWRNIADMQQNLLNTAVGTLQMIHGKYLEVERERDSLKLRIDELAKKYADKKPAK